MATLDEHDSPSPYPLPEGGRNDVVDGPPGTLLDAVDRLLHKGALLRGDVLLSIADVDLVWLDLGLILAAVETVEQARARRGEAPRPARAPGPPPLAGTTPLARALDAGTPPRVRVGPAPAP